MGAEHHVLDPVGRRPAGRAARTQTDTPRGAAIGDDLIGQRLELFHRGRDFIAGILEVFGDIPDQRLHIDLVEEAVEAVRAIRASISAQIDPGLARGIVLAHPVVGSGRKRR